MRGNADKLVGATRGNKQNRIVLHGPGCESPVKQLGSDDLLDLNGPTSRPVRARESGEPDAVALARDPNAPFGLGHCSIVTGI